MADIDEQDAAMKALGFKGSNGVLWYNHGSAFTTEGKPGHLLHVISVKGHPHGPYAATVHKGGASVREAPLVMAYFDDPITAATWLLIESASA